MPNQNIQMTSKKLTEAQKKEIALRKRLKEDFLAYSLGFLKIKPKEGGLVPLKLNSAQLYIHQQLEKQKKQTGKVRALVVKGRQQGCSTYIEGRFIWKVTQEQGKSAFILTHRADATASIFSMAKRYYDNLPGFLKPEVKANNTNELYFGELDSGYKVSTAGAEGVGRGSTIQYVHGSEVAFWQGAEEHMSGLMEAVPAMPGTEIILESTSDGPGKNYFYRKCMSAQKDPDDEFQLIFVPWYWQPEYRLPLKPDFKLTDEESNFKRAFNLDDEQIYWRRVKIKNSPHGIHQFNREYPATVDEAFAKAAEGALWDRESFRYIYFSEPQPRFIRTVIGLDPAMTKSGRSDRTGIIVASLADDGKVYIRQDATAKYAPIEWGHKVVDLYHKYQAQLVIAETNQGGEMVETILRNLDPMIAYKGIHVQTGSLTRAEPVAHCYQRGEVVHYEGLQNLELAQCGWNPYAGEHTPDEISALTRALTELFKLQNRGGKYRCIL